MTFQEMRRSLLLRSEYGTIKAREEMEKEFWNAALNEASMIVSMNYPHPDDGYKDLSKKIEKLKV